jgi:hypothetical protein
METQAHPQTNPFIMISKPHKRHRNLQIPSKVEPQPSDIDMSKHNSAETSCMLPTLPTLKETELEEEKKREEELSTKNEDGNRMYLELSGPICRKRSPTSKGKSPSKRSVIVLESLQASHGTQTCGDSLSGHIIGACTLTQRLHRLQTTLHMRESPCFPAVLYHRSEQREAQRRPARAASHVAVAAYIKTSRKLS